MSVTAHRHRDSPRVRRLAREHGVDLDRIRPSGRHGRATAADVRASVASADPEVAAPVVAARVVAAPAGSVSAGSVPVRVERLSRRRKVIAERMHRSLLESAQLTTVVEADLTQVSTVRAAVKDEFHSRYGVSLSVLAFVAEAAVRALVDHPVINARLDLAAGTVTYPSSVGLGIAVDTEEGLVVPVIRGADDLNVGALARRIADLAARARSGTAAADDFSGGTFTITNTGSRGALFDTPILNAPESAILGLGTVVRRPVVLRGGDGEELIAIRSMAYLALTYDHRLVDGADAARYLASVKERLENPARSWEDSVGVAR
ncbi:2-oxo acid dehydrogenase subunit E2 [Kribbella sp. NPDC049227]|uniref:2-oxo acid dehydrogenase subunit E2 n=1 Tax=Kribbella sp. NPDC049227 TaxID=3364113 RepID=UPI00371E87A2